ncbi:D-inositol 3-phosphate glycosyltransferase [Candidatus Desulfarcum epimagneticum]|uniref:D-inositol 3-phosphate glycosyltransferase n=1 Tax=uncultured Desulfobacteraceae bacterium TaxID=218296 RepID=A0A484HJT8_9BACT|nr:D-inositol 3-phosphate glycosyltransferase [uncultured Desulfobacteraceae bacterium]
MKIALIGPAYPFRGGVAHHSAFLARALQKENRVEFISWKRQYPGFLFPGQSDLEPGPAPVKLENVHRIIDPVNPLTWMAAFRRIKSFCPDLVIFPWWTAFWAPVFLFVSILIKRSLDAKIIFICHNVFDHEAGRLKKLAAKAVLSMGDRLMVHSSEDRERIRRLTGGKKDAAWGFHPTYAPLATGKYEKGEAKKKMGLEKNRVLLFFGMVRAYKGLDVLIDAMPRVIARRKDVRLIVAGEFWEDKAKYARRIMKHNIQDYVVIKDGYIPNDRLPDYFCAADLAVLPYKSASGSGVCQLALGFGLPVIATDAGSLSEVIEDGTNGGIVPTNGPQALAEAICEALETDVLKTLTQGAAKTKDQYSWEKMADMICGL